MNTRAIARQAFLCVFAVGSVAAASAQVVVVPSKPVVGSSNPATPVPPIARPSTTPCTVTLFSNEQFADYSAHPVSFAPPTGCGNGPWAKVVFTADFTVTAGRQYDRTASLYLGNANIFYGTTAEPRSALSPSWHVERDVTDLSALFKTAQTGQAIIYNIVNSTYTGIIYATAQLEFYPANFRNPAPVVPDVVVPISGANSPYELDTTSSAVTATITAPRNTEKAYLDIIAQSQSNDEFWYLCAPSAVAGELESCGNTAFRETEVTIDGKPAGVAPVYPWIYTGGIDPYLWEPIPGIQTLDFHPYRVDLSPFAGILSDGLSHTVAISVYNADSYFLATANLLLYRDHGRERTGGGLIADTLDTAPTPVVTQNLSTSSTGEVTGTVDVTSTRKYKVSGYVDTSHGRVIDTVESRLRFDSNQTFDVAAAGIPETQNTIQTSTADQTSTQQFGPITTAHASHISFPVVVLYALTPNADGTYNQVVTAGQEFTHQTVDSLQGFPLFESKVHEVVKSNDTLQFSSGFSVLAVGPTTSSASYVRRNSEGACFSRDLASSNRVLTSVTDGKACKEQ